MTKSSVNQLIELVVSGRSAQQVLIEDKLAAVDPELDKARNNVVKELEHALSTIKSIRQIVVSKDIARGAGAIWTAINNQVEFLKNL